MAEADFVERHWKALWVVAIFAGLPIALLLFKAEYGTTSSEQLPF